MLGDDHPRTLQIVQWLDPPASIVGGDCQEGARAPAWARRKRQLNDESTGRIDPGADQPLPGLEFSGHHPPVSQQRLSSTAFAALVDANVESSVDSVEGQ
jgi:hypothetical protein